jgi:hypothetical protein
LTAAAIARLIEIAWSVVDSGFGSDNAVHG